MKRIIAYIVTAALCLCFTACGTAVNTPVGNAPQPTVPTQPPTPPTPMVLGETVTAEGYAQATLYRIETTQKISASVGDTLYYQNNEEGMTYVDVVLDVVNLGATTKPLGFAKLTGKSDDGTVYAGSLYAFESGNGYDIVRDGYMEINGSYRYHAALVVPDTTKTLDLTLTLGEERYSIAYTVGERVCEVSALAVGDALASADGTQLTLREVTYADRIDPSQAGTYYTYYSVDDENNTYLAVIFDAIHQTADGKFPDAFVGVTAVYGEEQYTGFAAVEDKNGQGFTTDESVAPQESRLLYCLIEVPKTATEQELTLRITFDQKEYDVVM